MPFLRNSNDVDIFGGQMNEVAGDFYASVGHKADGDQYFGTVNPTATRSPGGGSISVGVNSGLVDVDHNSGRLDVGTNTVKGRLEIRYNGPSGRRGIRDTRARNQDVSAVGTSQERRGGPIFPGHSQTPGTSLNQESRNREGEVLRVVSSQGEFQAGGANSNADAQMNLVQEAQSSQEGAKLVPCRLPLSIVDKQEVTANPDHEREAAQKVSHEAQEAQGVPFLGKVQSSLNWLFSLMTRT